MTPLTLLLADKVGKTPLYEDKNSLRASSSSKKMNWKDLFFEERKAFFMMLGFMALPFILTGIFIQQGDLVESRGFDMKEAAIGFIFFSCFQIMGNTLFGHLVDKYGAFKLVFFLPFFLFLGVFLLMMGGTLNLFYISFGFLGFSVGVQSSVVNAFWAEVYGTRYLGKMKGMDSTMVVLSTSLAPLVFSFLLDHGFSFQGVLVFCLGVIVLSTLSLLWGFRLFNYEQRYDVESQNFRPKRFLSKF
jgi:MFS family permease